MSKAKRAKDDWRAKLARKKYEIYTWDWKENAKPYITALCKPFGIRPTFTNFDPYSPDQLLLRIARKHRLHLYQVPGLEGSDAYGFVLSKQTLDTRELQQIEADNFGEEFDEVYGGYIATV